MESGQSSIAPIPGSGQVDGALSEGLPRERRGEAVKYKGYTAVLKLDEEQGILFGRVIGLRDVITFQAETVPQAIEEFRASVDSYLELCRSRQESPEKPYSGNFMVRVDPELHRQIATWAQVKSVSINSLVARLIRHACARRRGTANVEIGDLLPSGEGSWGSHVSPAKAKGRKLSQPQPPKKPEVKAARRKPKAPRR